MNMMRRLGKVKKIVLHCSDSEWGDAEVIDKWHKERGFDCIGYHYVIVGGRVVGGKYHEPTDGWIQKGRSIEYEGAHCRGHNGDSVGVCIIGRRHFTGKQFEATLLFINSLLVEYDLGVNALYGHTELDPKKTCPNLKMDFIRNLLTKLRGE